ncbi:MAG: primosomal protein N' [Phycisphaerae bacterium]|nr:primosomal protein N' [Phycisphaerae bacterium]
MTKLEQEQLEFPQLQSARKAAPVQAQTRTALVATVAVDVPLDRVYSYSVPDELKDQVRPGMLVQVPLGPRQARYQGFVLTVSQQEFTTTLKPILAVLDERVLFDAKLLELGRWLSDYYVCPPGTAMAAMIPSAVLEGKRSSRVKPYIREALQVEPTFGLNEEQERVLERMLSAVRAEGFSVLLVHGVTASGKTELYVRAIKEALAMGKSAIYLVPEIALTTQMIHRLAERFEKVAILHSGLTDAQRRETWYAVADGRVKVIIGTRSAIFAPAPDLGVIVVDEEHEPSYKNIQSPRFNTRDLAIKRAQLEGLPVILGSATPALESFHNAQHNPHWQYLSLPKRVADLPMPSVSLVDMQQEMFERKGVHLLSRLMESRIDETLKAGKQTILLLNRRGYASFVFCPSCKFVMTCPNCKMNMVYHKSSGKAACHRCSARLVVPEKCDRCGHKMNKFGLGTQRIEEELKTKFPDARIARMDTDVMTKPQDYERTLGDFAAGKTDILLGTQMIAKGLDFPNVALVGVVSADMTLSMPDFRAAERTFQLVAQVAGRAGRADHAGTVVVQSYSLSSPAIQSALRHDYLKFAKQELFIRRKLSLPPLGRITRIVIQDARLTQVQQIAKDLAVALQQLAQRQFRGIAVFGPNPCAISRIRSRYRQQLLIKAPTADLMRKFLARARADGLLDISVRQVQVDVDPVDLM